MLITLVDLGFIRRICSLRTFAAAKITPKHNNMSVGSCVFVASFTKPTRMRNSLNAHCAEDAVTFGSTP